VAAEFDLTRIVDLIAMERRRADDQDRRASELEAGDRYSGGTPSVQAEVSVLRTAAYWHNRTAHLIEEAVPAARNWTGKGYQRSDG
jgi:hypothetical protein